jgi:hypothetical protein
MIEDIYDATVAPDDRDIMKLFTSVPLDRIYGRGLAAYLPLKTYNAGGYGVMAEEGEFPVPAVSAQTEGKLNVIKQALSFGITDESMQAMSGGRKQLRQSLDGILRGGLESHKARLECQLYGMGDGVIADSTTERVTSASTFTSDIPIRGVEGDQILWFRHKGATTIDATTAAYITSIDHENMQFSISTSPSNTIMAQAHAYYKGTTTGATIGTDYVNGLEAMLDRQTGSVVDWDTSSSAGHDHVETFQNLSRSTNTKMRCQLYNASGATVTLSNLQIGPSMSMAQGVSPGNLIAIMHPKQFRRIVKLFSGAMEIKNMDIQLPAGRANLPTLSGMGMFQLPCIVSYYHVDGIISYVDKTQFIRVGTEQEWKKVGGSRLIMMWGGTAEYTDVYHMYMTQYSNYGCKAPFRNTVTKGLSTS